MTNEISTCMIVKNEIKNLPLLIGDLRKFSDEIIIVDTGSTDGTLEWLNENADDVLKVYNFEWIDNFSAARNFSFSKATKDWIFWCDADDRISDNLYNEMMAVKTNTLGKDEKYVYVINYDYDKVNKITVQTYRLVARETEPMWVCCCHEYLVFGKKMTEDNIGQFDPLSFIVHQKHGDMVVAPQSYFETATHRNLQIYLTQMLSEHHVQNVHCRDIFNYAREIFNVASPIFYDAVCRTAEYLIERKEEMYCTDLWNCIMLLLHDKLISSKENAKHGIELINTIEKATRLRPDVVYFREHLKKIVNPRHNLTKISKDVLKLEPVDPIDQFLEKHLYSKVLPAINVYNKSKDNAEKEVMISIISEYANDVQEAQDFLSNLKPSK